MSVRVIAGIILFISALGFQTATYGQTSAEIKAKVDAIVAEATKGKDVAVVVGVLAPGQKWIYGYGETAKGNGQRPNGFTLFGIGSVTKTFTATQLASAASRGLVKLDDPLEKYIPVSVPAYNGRKIRLDDLATHTACLPRDIPGSTYPTSPQQAFDFISKYKLSCEPGSRYLYSNIGWGLLGLALVRAEKAQGWEDLVKREVTGPLGMTDTTIELTPDQRARKAQGYDGAKPTSEQSAGFPASNSSGALFSTAQDMLTFMKFNLGELPDQSLNPLLDVLHKPRFAVNEGLQIALAWEYRPGNGNPYYTKDGKVHGFRAFVAFDNVKKVAVVVMINNVNIAPGKDIGYKVLSYLRKTANEAYEDESEDTP